MKMFGNNLFRLLAFILLFVTRANGLIVKLSDLHTMAENSDIVVHGYVGQQDITTDELGRPITLTQLEVIDGLFNAKTGDVILIYQVGGTKDGLVMPMLGGHHYRLGQQVILFGLELDGAYVSFGAGQGKFDIVKNGKKDLVLEDLGDVLCRDNSSEHGLIRPMPLIFEDKVLVKDEIRKMLKTR